MAIRGRRFPSEVRANFKGEEHRRDWVALNSIPVPTIMHFLEFRGKYKRRGINAAMTHGEEAWAAIEKMQKQARLGHVTSKMISKHGRDAIIVAEKYGPSAITALNRHGARILTAIENAERGSQPVKEMLKAWARKPPETV